MIKALLQGKPFGHPLHPLLVHLPIGLLILSLLLDLGTLLFDGGNDLVRGAFYTMLFGVIMALVAAVPGLVDRADIREDHPARPTANTHLVLNLTAVGLYVVSLVLRYLDLDAEATGLIAFLLSLVGAAILSYSGYLGGTMVYGDGIAVGRHRRKSETPELTIRVGPAEVRSGYAPVAEVGRLPEGATLRAEVNGQVMTIANVGGDYYAFQEFCTHRFGPLSEGHFEDHQIMCPWHGSCFDVRSGKVTQGPAKVDLKTYPVMVEAGWVCVGDGE